MRYLIIRKSKGKCYELLNTEIRRITRVAVSYRDAFQQPPPPTNKKKQQKSLNLCEKSLNYQQCAPFKILKKRDRGYKTVEATLLYTSPPPPSKKRRGYASFKDLRPPPSIPKIPTKFLLPLYFLNYQKIWTWVERKQTT